MLIYVYAYILTFLSFAIIPDDEIVTNDWRAMKPGPNKALCKAADFITRFALGFIHICSCAFPILFFICLDRASRIHLEGNFWSSLFWGLLMAFYCSTPWMIVATLVAKIERIAMKDLGAELPAIADFIKAIRLIGIILYPVIIYLEYRLLLSIGLPFKIGIITNS